MGLLTKPEAKPDVDAIKAAAEALEINLPKSKAAGKLVTALREGFAARLEGIPKDDWIVCPKCGEFTDDAEELDACPFCGDDGLDEDAPEPAVDPEDEDAPEAIDGADQDPEDEDAPEEPPTVDVDNDADDADAEEDLDTDTEDADPDDEPADPAESTAIVPATDATVMTAALKKEKALIKRAQTAMVGSGYDMGESLLRIHKGELWKAEGHKTFRKFLDTVGVSSTLAYDLMGLVEKFDRKTFMEVGRKRLLIVAKADKGDQNKLLDAAKEGATRRELEKEAKKGKDPAAPPKDTPAESPAKEDMITLLAKVGGRPKSYRFTDRKTRKALKSWAEESFVEIQISPDVTQLLGLKRNDEGEITGINVAFVRVESKPNGATKAPDAPDAPEDSAPTTKKARGKAKKPAAPAA